MYVVGVIDISVPMEELDIGRFGIFGRYLTARVMFNPEEARSSPEWENVLVHGTARDFHYIRCDQQLQDQPDVLEMQPCVVQVLVGS